MWSLSSFIIPFVIIGTIVLSSVVIASAATAKDSGKVKVDVRSGPTKCKKKDKIQVDTLVGIHYRATVDKSSKAGEKGRQLDSSYDKGYAQEILVGRGKVIKGLDIGLIGLCVDAKATLIIPPHLAYGDQGNPPHLPGGVTLKYEVEILTVKPAPPPPPESEFAKIDFNKDGKISVEEAEDYFDQKEQPINIDKLWKDEDKDKDGFISWDEFTGPKGDRPPPQPIKKEPQQAEVSAATIFKDLDIDSDGKLTRKELNVLFVEIGQELTDKFWDDSDLDKDGFVSWAEFIGSKDDSNSSEKDEL
mmetsp:Transcript_32487/g.39929  ORF Transcript_32487/g.39929 Transcript_32487/m.39929 type:complete len:303 (-) Transcript_32487:298-1206(-)